MAHQRSPNYPQIPFSDAIEKGRKVYSVEHTHPAAKLVVAGDLGYTSLNGRSLTLIGTLRQYGILEGSGESMRVSDAAVAYYELEDGEERRAAIAAMVFKPSLFSEMKTQFGDMLPGEGNLRHWLVKKSFLPKAADDVIRVYKANLALVGGEQTGYSGTEQELPEAPMNPTVTQTMIQKPAPGVQTYAFALSASSRAELSLKGTITVDDLEMLRDHVELTIKALTRTAKAETEK